MLAFPCSGDRLPPQGLGPSASGTLPSVWSGAGADTCVQQEEPTKEGGEQQRAHKWGSEAQGEEKLWLFHSTFLGVTN